MTDHSPKCELCGEPMPPGEEMFKYHGHSGPCPRMPLAPSLRPIVRSDEGESAMNVPKFGECQVLATGYEGLAVVTDVDGKPWLISPGDGTIRPAQMKNGQANEGETPKETAQ